eukprot:7386069-Prymnesium_polylepis.1
MKKVDEQVVARTQQSFLKPLHVQRAAREAEARKKAAELELQRDRLLRKQRRQSRAEFSEGEDDDEEEYSDEDDELLPDGEQLDAELAAAQMELEALRPAQSGTAAAATTAAAAGAAATTAATTAAAATQ